MVKQPIAGGEEPRILTAPPLLPGLPGFAGKFIPMDQARELYERVRTARAGYRLEALLAEMKVELEVQSSDLDRIPVKGSLVAGFFMHLVAERRAIYWILVLTATFVVAMVGLIMFSHEDQQGRQQGIFAVPPAHVQVSREGKPASGHAE